MKITKIEKTDGIYYVTTTPNFFQRFFGLKERVDKYRHNGDVFTNFPHIKVYYRSDGVVLSWRDDITEALNNFDRRF